MRVDLYAGPAPQPSPYPARYGRNLLSAVALAVVFGYAAQVVELRPLELLRDLGNNRGHTNSRKKVQMYEYCRYDLHVI